MLLRGPLRWPYSNFFVSRIGSRQPDPICLPRLHPPITPPPATSPAPARPATPRLGPETRPRQGRHSSGAHPSANNANCAFHVPAGGWAGRSVAGGRTHAHWGGWETGRRSVAGGRVIRWHNHIQSVWRHPSRGLKRVLTATGKEHFCHRLLQLSSASSSFPSPIVV